MSTKAISLKGTVPAVNPHAEFKESPVHEIDIQRVHIPTKKKSSGRVSSTRPTRNSARVMISLQPSARRLPF
jgi:hypothetical protein